MDIHARADRIAQAIRAGRLPQTRPIKLWAGFGNGRTCDGCGEPILGSEVEHEHDLEDGRVLRFHGECSVIWQRMIEDKP